MQSPARPKAAAKPKKPRKASGESILIELMLKGPCSRGKLADETGLSENSIKMYVGGYLERIRKRPLRVAACKGDKFRLVRIEEAEVCKKGGQQK